MKKLDVFNEFYEPLETPTETIDLVHRQGLWHQTFACWVINPNRESVLLQLRGPDNRIDPGTYDASASGHLDSGERPEDGFRELKEELGIEIDIQHSRHIGIFRNLATRGGYINREFCNVFLVKSYLDLDSLVMQHGEVLAVSEYKVKDLISLFERNDGCAYPISSTIKTKPSPLTIQKMCNWKERCLTSKYYLRVFLCAHDYLNNKEIITL